MLYGHFTSSLKVCPEQRHRRVEGCRGGQAEPCSVAAGLALRLLQKYLFHITPETGWFAAVTTCGVLAVGSHVPWIMLPSAVSYSFGSICRGWLISLQNTTIQSHDYDHITVRPEGLSQDQSWKLLQQKAVPMLSEDAASVSVSLLCLQ